MKSHGPCSVLALGGLLVLASLAGCERRPKPLPFRPNVLLITVDSLRADAVDPTPSGKTPALARLAAEGARFTNAFTVTPWTAPSLVSIFTGLYPPTHGVVNRDDTTPAALPSLPRLLGARGYTLRNYGFFTAVSYYRNLGLPEQAVVGAEVIGAQHLATWLPTAPEPFFAWIHLVEPHLPYGAGGYEAARASVPGSTGLVRAQLSATVPLGGGYVFEPGDREKLSALYEKDVAEMDRSISLLLSALEGRGLTDRTLVAFTADHGEELLDHGWVGHASTSGEAKLVDELLRVPLILRGPNVPRGKVVGALAQCVDLLPTILRLIGEKVPRDLQGVPLDPAFEGRAKRTRVFFDTTPGGHLTPDARRQERLQGVGDGSRIHAERLGAPPRPDDPRAPELAADLSRWRDEQTRARLKFLSRYGGAKRPDARQMASYAETLAVNEPAPERALRFHEAAGTIRLAFQGERRPGKPYWVEYEVGSGVSAVSGAFALEEASVSFGPFPVAFWNDLAGYSPFRFRILDPERHQRSAWRTFTLERAAAK